MDVGPGSSSLFVEAAHDRYQDDPWLPAQQCHPANLHYLRLSRSVYQTFCVDLVIFEKKCRCT